MQKRTFIGSLQTPCRPWGWTPALTELPQWRGLRGRQPIDRPCKQETEAERGTTTKGGGHRRGLWYTPLPLPRQETQVLFL